MVDEQLFKDFPNQIRMVFKHFPFPCMNGPEPAAVASECRVGKEMTLFGK